MTRHFTHLRPRGRRRRLGISQGGRKQERGSNRDGDAAGTNAGVTSRAKVHAQRRRGTPVRRLLHGIVWPV